MDNLFVKHALREQVMTKSDNAWPTYDGKTLNRREFVTASEATNCVRRLAFEKLREAAAVTIPNYWETMDPHEYHMRLEAMADDDKLGIFERGHHMELWVKDKLESYAYASDGEESVICMGDDQVSFYLKDARLSGTPDGIYLFHAVKEIRVIEIKSTDNRPSSPRDNHVAQVELNMAIVQCLIDEGKLVRLHGQDLSGYKVTGGQLIYVNPSNYLTLDEFFIPFTSEAFSKAADKAKMLFDGMLPHAPADLPPEGLEKWGACRFCDFKFECAAIEMEQKHQANAEKLRGLASGQAPAIRTLPFFANDTKREEIVRVILDYDAYNKAEKDAAAHKDALKDAVKQWIKTQPGAKVSFSDQGRVFKLSVSTSERAGGFDNDKLAAFLSQYGERVENFRKAASTTETLTVNVKVEDEE